MRGDQYPKATDDESEAEGQRRGVCVSFVPPLLFPRWGQSLANVQDRGCLSSVPLAS